MSDPALIEKVKKAQQAVEEHKAAVVRVSTQAEHFRDELEKFKQECAEKGIDLSSLPTQIEEKQVELDRELTELETILNGETQAAQEDTTS